MKNNIGSEPSRRDDHWRESVVDHHGDTLVVSYTAELGDISHRERRIRHGLEIQHVGFALDDRVIYHLVIADVHERRRYVARPWEEVSQQSVGPTREGPRCHHVSSAAA